MISIFRMFAGEIEAAKSRAAIEEKEKSEKKNIKFGE